MLGARKEDSEARGKQESMLHPLFRQQGHLKKKGVLAIEGQRPQLMEGKIENATASVIVLDNYTPANTTKLQREEEEEFREIFLGIF